MAHFAKVENGLVTQVIVADQEFINSGAVGDPGSWIQTSYNTRGGVHYGPDGNPDGGVALRKNYAGVGYTYDPVRDAFIPPGPPYPSWHLDESTCLWVAPIPMPENLGPGQYPVWDDSIQNWRIEAIDSAISQI